ncbi:hypothetical protein OZX65_05290 [Leuconostocaceae bacterium ESL0723]|nr:hypothetical protein [Lactobacillaceae bacterium L1_55_11]WEV54148.1 hypothetical protein OZX65_05290 [Leuconostocaceae bacterium ESL0723]
MDYLAALNQLRAGEIEQIEINPETFPEFQKAWSQFSYQNTVYGVAQPGGRVVYYRAK